MLWSILLIWILALSLNANGDRLNHDERQISYTVNLARIKQSILNSPTYDITKEGNRDLFLVPSFAGSFTKLFEHDLITGTLSDSGKKNYIRFIHALSSGKQEDFNAVSLAQNNNRVLVNPQAGYAFCQTGMDCASSTMPPAPNLSSASAGAEMLETYVFALCRDIKFDEYGTGTNSDNDGSGTSLTEKLATALDSLGDSLKGPRNSAGNVDASVLLRGNSKGDLVGPYISQFLLAPLYPLFPAGCAPFVAGLIGVGNLNQDRLAHEQQIPIAQQREFMVSWSDYIRTQNGEIPKTYVLSDYDQQHIRYPITGRDLGSYVHHDGPYEPYYNALNILLYRGAPLSSTNPYVRGLHKNQGPGIVFGGLEAYAWIGEITQLAMKAAWAHKWRGQLRLRPEAMAAHIHQAKVTGINPYNLHSCLFSIHNGIDILELIKTRNSLQATATYDPQLLLSVQEASTYLLGQMYPEGSPAHPSYPSGHATIAGACTTILKAMFNEKTPIKNVFTPIRVDPLDQAKLTLYQASDSNSMTIGGELNKLASNIALGRSFGGVHYRSDGEEGIKLGEQIAIKFLQDKCFLYHEEGFLGFELTKRDGTTIRITQSTIETVT
jgi:hypothetical protein